MYGKIFDKIYEGTLYGHWEALVTFQQMIVLCDADGIVDMTPKAIAARTSIPLRIIKKGIALLEAPDPHSRTPDQEGRRIELIDAHRPWGWQLVNHKKYLHMQDSDTVREQTRERVRRHRELKRSVTVGNGQKRHTDTDTNTKSKDKVAPLALPDWLDKETWNSWTKLRPAKARTPDALKAALEKLEGFRASGLDANAIVANSLSNGWRGLFPPDEKKGALQRPQPGSANRPSITCASCKQKTFTWTSDKCRPCWEKYMGMAA